MSLQRTGRPLRMRLSALETNSLQRLVVGAESHFASVEDPGFLAWARQFAPRLPLRLRDFLSRFARTSDAAAVISGWPVDVSLQATPGHWALAHNLDTARREDIYLCLAASLLGELFAWSTLQRGKLVTDVLPIAGEERAQSGHGTTLLAWHTEDAFHPHRCEHLLLLCLRNPAGVPTTVARLRRGDLSADQRRTLAEPRFYIRPDPEHVRVESSLPGAPDLGELAPHEPVAVLSGPQPDRHLRIDPLFMGLAPGDSRAAEALAAAVDALERNLVEIALRPGDLLVIDNRLAVHGRGSFTARHDGGDRWLKKVMVSTNPDRPRGGHGPQPWIVS